MDGTGSKVRECLACESVHETITERDYIFGSDNFRYATHI
jgi:hypothetical protein